jgi:hypothetical protein
MRNISERVTDFAAVDMRQERHGTFDSATIRSRPLPMVVTAIGSGLCGAARTIVELNIARLLQRIGAALTEYVALPRARKRIKLWRGNELAML